MDSGEISFRTNNIRALFESDNMTFTIDIGGKKWYQSKDFKPYMEVDSEKGKTIIYFKDALNIEHSSYKSGIGEGIHVKYSGFKTGDLPLDIEFETIVWLDYTYSELHFELIPVTEMKNLIKRIAWPGPFEFNTTKESSYTVLPLMQGIIIPNNWEHEIDIGKINDIENGSFYSRSSYMPWWGQIEENYGYMAIAETPWDGGYILNHPEGGTTSIYPVWNPSLGAISYRRIIKYIFFENCDYNILCKTYRNYVVEKGTLITLKEKAIKNNRINKLIGSPVVHTYVCNHVEPTSFYYDKLHLEKNDELVSFHERAKQLDRLKEKGIDSAFIHVDGWGSRGYDNFHPDVFPPCEKAGGWEGMKLLSDTCKKNGYMFATHDQYRDYYLDAKTYDPDQTIRNVKGETPYECIWNGGAQSVLCTQLAPQYIKRNFEILKQNGVELKGTYLDVFSAIGLDECDHHRHRMTKKECMEKRLECFDYVRAEGIIASSEETVDWSIPSLELSYRSNYVLNPNFNKGIPVGIPVPLFNLVYHDCVIVPWFMRKGGYEIPEGEDGMLHALLNGDTCYLEIEADREEINKAEVVCNLHKKVAKEEMIKHEFIDGNYRRQRTTFADGTVVEVDFETDEYKII
jgi:hypothetical protein